MITMFEANNNFDLRQILARSDVAVPCRTKGRTKNHTEKYTVAHLLSALMNVGIVNYPIRLIHRDRLDFLLYMGGQRIGIEHVEAVSENEARRKVLREMGYGPEVYFVSHKKPGEPKKKTKRLIEEIERNIAGDGWEGDSVETEWAEAMFYFYKKKIDTIKKEGFKRYDEDWLLIYDNWNLHAPNLDSATQIFYELITFAGGLQEFKRIFVMTNGLFYEISGKGKRSYAMNDLWKQTTQI